MKKRLKAVEKIEKRLKSDETKTIVPTRLIPLRKALISAISITTLISAFTAM